MNKLLRSFKYAFSGIWQCIQTERNFRIHMVAVCCVVWVSRFFELNGTEKAVLALACGMVLMGEMFNSALERAVDLVCEKPHPLAKAAKDLAAGAVLLSAGTAAAVGTLLFGHRENLKLCFAYFSEQPLRLIGLAGAVAAAILFVFIPWDRRQWPFDP